MTNGQIEAVGTAEDIARAAYQSGFGDGWSAARMVIEVMAQDERESGGAKGLEMLGRPPVVKPIPVAEGPNSIN